MKRIIKAMLAAICALLCINTVCFFYYAVPGVISRKNAATNWIWYPGGRYISAYEGSGVTYFDENGYSNPQKELNDSYILMMGSSHAEGTHVKQEDRMASVLNKLFGEEDKLKVYNIARAGNFLPDVIKGFSAATEEFSESSVIVIEISNTTFSTKELKNSIMQSEFDPAFTGKSLVNNQSIKTELKNTILKNFPYLILLKNKQFVNAKIGFDGAFGLRSSQTDTKSTDEFDLDEYSRVLNEGLALIRSEYDNPIIMLYHPAVKLQSDGTMSIERDVDTYELMVETCKNNNLTFLDMGDSFLKEYDKNYIVPYGFENTSMGVGHLNANGHRIVAEELYRVINELKGAQ